jgi:hypothetical protein
MDGHQTKRHKVLIRDTQQESCNRKNSKVNELGFQEMAAILSPLGLYGGNRKMKLPLLH